MTGLLYFRTSELLYKRLGYEAPLLACIAHLIEQLLLPVTQIGRQRHIIRDDKIAIGTVAPVIAFAPQTHTSAILRLRLYLQLNLRAIAQLDDHLTTQQSRVEVNVHLCIHLTRTRAGRTRREAMTSAMAKQILKET